MGDIKLFQVRNDGVKELEVHSFAVEKSVQTLLEKHLDVFLGVKFLASEYSTGNKHGGRIDTLGIDENGCPVIIEYKRAINENVINQGLYYLDWLMDHKAEFQLLTLKILGTEEAEKIEWSSPRLLCIAGDFTKYDVHAVTQINRNIELIRHRRYGNDFLLLDLVNVVTAAPLSNISMDKKTISKDKTVVEYLAGANTKLQDLYESVEAFLLALGEDIQKKTLKNYFAFQRIKNFACVEVHPQKGKLLIYAKADFDTLKIDLGFMRDVRKIGHFGTGDLELTIRNSEELEKAKPILLKSYEMS